MKHRRLTTVASVVAGITSLVLMAPATASASGVVSSPTLSSHWTCTTGGYSNGDSFAKLTNPGNSSEWFRVSFFNPTSANPTYRIHLSASHDDWFRVYVVPIENGETLSGEIYDYFGSPETYEEDGVEPGWIITMDLTSVQGSCLSMEGRS